MAVVHRPGTERTSAARRPSRRRQAKTPRALLGRLHPDLIVGDPERPAAIIDAKYKILTPTHERQTGVEREDLYQLTSYLSAHIRPPLPLGMLAYHASTTERRRLRSGKGRGARTFATICASRNCP